MKTFLFVVFALLFIHAESRSRKELNSFQIRALNAECQKELNKLNADYNKGGGKIDIECDNAYKKINEDYAAAFKSIESNCGADVNKMPKDCYLEMIKVNEAFSKEIDKLDSTCDAEYFKTLKNNANARQKLLADCAKAR